MYENFLKSILLLILAFSLPVYSQGTELSLDDAVFKALENNREIRNARLEINKADAAVDEAFGYALPTVELSAQISHLIEKPKTPFPDFEAMLANSTYGVLFNEGLLPYDQTKLLPMKTKLQSFAQADNYEANAQITQIIFNSAVFTGIGASKVYLNLSKESLKSQVASVVRDTKQAYYSALLTKEMLEIVELSLKNARENLENVKALHEQGLTSDFDLLQVEVRVENIKPQVRELKNLLNAAKNQLKLVMGINREEKIELTGKLLYEEKENLNEDDLLYKAGKYNFDINTLRLKKQIDHEYMQIEKSGYYPTIAAFGRYTYAGSGDDFDFQSYSSSVVGLSFSWNLFNGNKDSKRVEQAKITEMQTGNQLELAEDQIALGITVKVDEVKKIKEEIEALNRNIGLAERAYEIAQSRYKEGTGTQLEIKNADLELSNARTNLKKATHDYIQALNEIEYLAGLTEARYIGYVNKKSLNK